MAHADLQDLSISFELKEEVLVEKRKYGDNERNSAASVRRAVIVKKERAFALVEFLEKDSSLKVDRQKIPYKRLKKVPKPKPPALSEAPTPARDNGNATPSPLRAVPPAFANVKLVPPQPEQKLVKLPRKEPAQQSLPTTPPSVSSSGVYPQGYIPKIEPTPEATRPTPSPVEPTPALDDSKRETRELGVGDDVLVHEILGQNARFSKPRRARIVERLHSGVRVVFADDKSEKAVQWNRLELAEDPAAPPSIQPPPKPPAAPPIEAKLTTPPPPIEAPKPISELTTWLEMGAQLLDQLVRKQAALRNEAKEHTDEAARLVALASEKTLEADSMQAQIDQVAPQFHAFSTSMLRKL